MLKYQRRAERRSAQPESSIVADVAEPATADDSGRNISFLRRSGRGAGWRHGNDGASAAGHAAQRAHTQQQPQQRQQPIQQPIQQSRERPLIRNSTARKSSGIHFIYSIKSKNPTKKSIKIPKNRYFFWNFFLIIR